MLSEVRELGRRGFFVRPGFLSAQLAASTLERGRGRLMRPGLVGGRTLRQDAQLRGDEICWLEQGDEPEVFAAFAALGAGVEAEARLVLSRFTVQLACYRAGSGGYGEHLDSAASSGGRRLTATCYLSDLRGTDDGGQLQLTPLDGGGAAETVRPAPGLLMCFRSDAVRHCVLPCARERWALTAWYY